jgi:hypothetical protein
MSAGFGAAAAEDSPTRAITGKIDIKRRFFMGRASLLLLESNNGTEYNPMVLKRIQDFWTCADSI